MRRIAASQHSVDPVVTAAPANPVVRPVQPDEEIGSDEASADGACGCGSICLPADPSRFETQESADPQCVSGHRPTAGQAVLNWVRVYFPRSERGVKGAGAPAVPPVEGCRVPGGTLRRLRRREPPERLLGGSRLLRVSRLPRSAAQLEA